MRLKTVYCSFYKADRILAIVMLSFLNTVMCCYLSKNAMQIFTCFKRLLSQNINLRKNAFQEEIFCWKRHEQSKNCKSSVIQKHVLCRKVQLPEGFRSVFKVMSPPFTGLCEAKWLNDTLEDHPVTHCTLDKSRHPYNGCHRRYRWCVRQLLLSSEAGHTYWLTGYDTSIVSNILA